MSKMGAKKVYFPQAVDIKVSTMTFPIEVPGKSCKLVHLEEEMKNATTLVGENDRRGSSWSSFIVCQSHTYLNGFTFRPSIVGDISMNTRRAGLSLFRASSKTYLDELQKIITLSTEKKYLQNNENSSANYQDNS